jgi:hypothetical protein
VGHPSNFNFDSLAGATLLSHNSYFDETVYESLVRNGLAPKIDFAAWHCTANLSAYLSNRRSLADAVKFFFKEDVSKVMRNWMSGRTWEDAIALGKDKAMLEYARQDAHWCWKLWNDLSSQWPEHERKLSRLTIDSGKRGVAIDISLLETYTRAIQQQLIDIESSLPWTQAGAPPTSPKAIAEQCRVVGIPCAPVKSHEGGEEAFAEWETKWGAQYAWVANVGQWRSINKVLGTLETIKTRIRPDGTIEAPLKYAGAHTLRWSGESGLNFQNFRKDPLVCKDVAVDIRRLIIPRGSRKFIICDLSQIEPRVMAWVTNNTAMLNLISDGMNIYEAFARVSMDWNGGNLKKENADLYQLAKSQVLGLGYGCGWEKFITIAAGYGVQLDEPSSRSIVEKFRANNPGITALWRTLDNAFKRSVGDKEFKMELPSGRYMTYRNVTNSIRIKTDAEGKVIRERTVVAEITRGGKAIKTPLYGGLLTENAVQAIARDVFAEHLLELDAAGFKVAFTVHDEVVLEVDPAVPVSAVEKIMAKTPDWLQGCPIAAEGHKADYYKK